MRRLDILSCLALLPFSGVMVTDALSKSKSFHLSAHASPGLIPVSFRSWRKVAVFFPEAYGGWFPARFFVALSWSSIPLGKGIVRWTSKVTKGHHICNIS